MRFLVTGDAGFIGFHVSQYLLAAGHVVCGIDGLTDYYDVALKQRRLEQLAAHARFQHHTLMIEDDAAVTAVFADFRPDIVIHLAAQAGVRYSLEAPRQFVNANVIGTFNIIEAARHYPVQHLMLASTSSAYGANEKYPFHETDNAVHPVTIYAATKGATELMAHAYAHLYAIPTTAFRFFTVYGPWGRPDMAYFLFTRRILNGEPIEVYNNGESWRDFTYIDDLVTSIVALSGCIPPVPSGRAPLANSEIDTLSPVAPYRLVNIGAGQPVKLTDFIDEIEQAIGLKAIRVLKPLPAGDVEKTFANTDLLFELTGQRPATPISTGIPAFVRWFRAHFNA